MFRSYVNLAWLRAYEKRLSKTYGGQHVKYGLHPTGTKSWLTTDVLHSNYCLKRAESTISTQHTLDATEVSDQYQYKNGAANQYDDQLEEQMPSVVDPESIPPDCPTIKPSVIRDAWEGSSRLCSPKLVQNSVDGRFPNSDRYEDSLWDEKAAQIATLKTSNRARRKVDLSSWNLRDREARAIRGSTHTTYRTPTTLRGSSGLRQQLVSFVNRVQPLLSNTPILPYLWQPLLDDVLLNSIVRKESVAACDTPYNIKDTMAWSWILSGNDSAICVRRYVELSRDSHRRQSPLPPRFICLQLLRFNDIDAKSLHSLWAEYFRNSTQDAVKDLDSMAIFLIRMLRHARRVDHGLYEPISDIVLQLFPIHGSQEDPATDIDYIQKLAHFCNRYLTLLALPVPGSPFGAVAIQQRAQLKIARFMHDSKPEIPINREGYRAFIKLQLRHAKTPAEQDWARVKGPRWPPWRKDELGIQAKIEYPGRYSRVMKVLQRMRDAGYGPTEYEQAAQILAGWDTDLSPTIQVRRVMNSKPMSWLRSIFGSDAEESTAAKIQHDIWAARIEATRSVREAWLCFYSYMKDTEHDQRRMSVYYAMFDKLLANIQHTQDHVSALPGDGKEVYGDAGSARDRVYIPTEPLSVDELYAQMLGDNIQPAGRLLASLLDKAPSLSQGFKYIEDCTLNEVKRDVLQHAEKYSHETIRSTISSIPNYLFASFINLLVRRSPSEDNFLLWPTSRSEPNHALLRGPVRSFHYAMRMLEIAEVTYIPPYNALLEGLRSQSTILRKRVMNDDYLKDRALTRLWKSSLHTLELMQQNKVVPNRATFRLCTMLGQRAMLMAPSRFRDPDSSLAEIPDTLKCLFVRALTMPANVHQQWLARNISFRSHLTPAKELRDDLLPECKDLELMFFILVVAKDHSSVLPLLRWMNQGQEILIFNKSNDRSRRQMLAAIRVAVEGSWESTQNHKPIAPFTADQFEEAVGLCSPFGWAADEDVEEFIQSRRKMQSDGWNSSKREGPPSDAAHLSDISYDHER